MSEKGKNTKTYYSEDYLPMKNRELDKASKKMLREVKAYIKNLRGVFGRRKRIKEYKKHRLQEYLDVAWDLQIDNLTFIYIIRSYTDKQGFVKITLDTTVDDETGEITKYDIGNRERGWNSVKERVYEEYLNTHKDCIEAKEIILINIKKEIEKRA